MSFGNTIKDGTGNSYWLLVDSEGRLIVSPGFTPGLSAEETANDSDKSFTVPANTEWMIKSIWVELITTVSAGDRQMEIQIQDDSADVIGSIRAGIVQTASLTRYYLFALGVADLTSFRDTDHLTTPIPELWLPASYVLRVFDNAAVDVAADDMVVQIRYASRAV